MIALIVMTDGRGDLLEQSMLSLEMNVSGPITRRIIHDDSGDDVYQRWLRRTFRNYEVVFHPSGRQGFGGAYRNAWRFLTGVEEPWIFSTEDDFTYNRNIYLDELMGPLQDDRHLIQVALRRQPWNADEIAAGGIVEQNPEAYTDRGDFLEHELYFTTNPSIFRRSLCSLGWPSDPNSEGKLRFQLKQLDPACTFAYWGSTGSGEWVNHIGQQRVGTGY